MAENYRAEGRELLGASYWDSLLIAKEHGVLVSDDIRLRQLGAGELGVTSVCSATLLISEMQQGRLQPDRYADCLVTKLLSGYRAVPTDVNVLRSAARRDGWHAEGTFKAAVRTLEGPGVDLPSAVRVAVQFLQILWLDPVLDQLRLELVFHLLDGLSVGRRGADVQRALEAQIRITFQLLPFPEREVLGLIAQWRRSRLA